MRIVITDDSPPRTLAMNRGVAAVLRMHDSGASRLTVTGSRQRTLKQSAAPAPAALAIDTRAIREFTGEYSSEFA